MFTDLHCVLIETAMYQKSYSVEHFQLLFLTSFLKSKIFNVTKLFKFVIRC